jgi:hypothetical protein
LEEGQRCYAIDSGLVKVDAIFDPHRPYQSPSVRPSVLREIFSASEMWYSVRT